MGNSGHVAWPSSDEPIWEFDWYLRSHPYEEGIAIEQAYYRGEKVFWKASAPMARVQYHEADDGVVCGPYDDTLSYETADTTSRCPSTRGCTYTYSSTGTRAIAVEAYYEIGNYRIIDRWVFWEDGWIRPVIFSGGLQCHADHTHHAYWRFDFDINGHRDDMVFEYNSDTGDSGWGPGWTLFDEERAREKDSSSDRSWAVMDRDTGMGYHVLPDPDSAPEDSFEPHTLWAVRYDYDELHHGRTNHAYDSDLDQYVDGEDIDTEDDLLWYSGHLDHGVHPHDETGGGVDEWLDVGPWLVPFRYPD